MMIINITITVPLDPQYYSDQVKSSTSHPPKHTISVAAIYTILCMTEVCLQEINICFLDQKEQGRQSVVER